MRKGLPRRRTAPHGLSHVRVAWRASGCGSGHERPRRTFLHPIVAIGGQAIGPSTAGSTESRIFTQAGPSLRTVCERYECH